MSEKKKYFGWTPSGFGIVDKIPNGGVRETLFFRADANTEGLLGHETDRIITSMRQENKLFGSRIKHSLREALQDIKSLDENNFLFAHS